MIKRYTLPEMGRIWEDENKFHWMLQVELLVCEALSREGKIPKEALNNIKQRAKIDLTRIQEIENKTRHDIIAFVAQVCENLKEESRYFHFGLTSSDLLDTVLAVNLREAAKILIADTKKLLNSCAKRAREHKRTVCVGRTHGMHAEPITFGLKLALFYDEMKRNLQSLEEALEAISYGKISGAVGTYAHLSPAVEAYVCKKLNLKPAGIASQIIPRDRHARFISSLALVGSSLERFAQEIRHLQRSEVAEVLEPFTKTQKGSSAMPHKRNPILCERICGLARILRGNAQVALENIALWHERDISHSSAERIIIPDSTILLDYMLQKFNWVVENLVVYKDKMEENLEESRGLIFSQRLLLRLMEKGLSRIESYDLVQQAASRLWETNLNFKDVLMNTPEIKKYLKVQEIEDCFNVNSYLKYVDNIFKQVGL
ncbi:MAG: adenylosuccinate lyase [Candidatus Omnitrophota bacterium]|nr:MAG: adenylosuccinate lyase [Candidatus Omnitrophota bacterium]